MSFASLLHLAQLLDLVVSVLTNFPVCVSSLMIDEIKRIIKDSEIMKFVSLFSITASMAGNH